MPDLQENQQAVESSTDTQKTLNDAMTSIKERFPDPLTPEIAAERDRRILEQRARDQLRERSTGLSKAAFLATVGEAYRGCTFENYSTKNVSQVNVVCALKEYVAGFREFETTPNLVLFGPVGTGKDHLAIATAAAILEHTLTSIEWLHGGDVFGRIRDAMDSGESERSLVASLAKPEIVIFSDPIPPTGELGSHMMGMFLRIVDVRCRNGRSTWTTLNVAEDAEADRRMGEASWDRLCHGAWKIKCAWPSHRKPAKTINC